ncbi:unnamed protein product [Prorocentrum cordatum]|uniref:Subtilisin n=1 Tax=Prorocentrum cordatum TaxID=2364126 RepID=A0ABN9R3M0_9DINO|nr:unnamed protein product [Polarella glacialis]
MEHPTELYHYVGHSGAAAAPQYGGQSDPTGDSSRRSVSSHILDGEMEGQNPDVVLILSTCGAALLQACGAAAASEASGQRRGRLWKESPGRGGDNRRPFLADEVVAAALIGGGVWLCVRPAASGAVRPRRGGPAAPGRPARGAVQMRAELRDQVRRVRAAGEKETPAVLAVIVALDGSTVAHPQHHSPAVNPNDDLPVTSEPHDRVTSATPRWLTDVRHPLEALRHSKERASDNANEMTDIGLLFPFLKVQQQNQRIDGIDTCMRDLGKCAHIDEKEQQKLKADIERIQSSLVMAEATPPPLDMAALAVWERPPDPHLGSAGVLIASSPYQRRLFHSEAPLSRAGGGDSLVPWPRSLPGELRPAAHFHPVVPGRVAALDITRANGGACFEALNVHVDGMPDNKRGGTAHYWGWGRVQAGVRRTQVGHAGMGQRCVATGAHEPGPFQLGRRPAPVARTRRRLPGREMPSAVLGPLPQAAEPADPLEQLKQLVASLAAVKENPKAAEVADALSNLVPVLRELIAASTLKSAEITGLTCTAISEYAPDTGAPLVCSNVFVDSSDIAAPGDGSYVWAADNEGASDKLGGCVGIWIEVTLPDEYTVDIVTIRQRYAPLDQGDEMDVALKSTSGAVLSTQHITFTDVGTSNPLEEAFSLTPTAGVKSIRFTFTKVLSNDEVVLPNPWDVVVNTPSDRDVGTVTEHAFAPAYELEVVPDSLETAAEQSGGAPTIAIRRILVAETKNSTQPPPSYRMGGVGGQTVRHLNGMENPAGATTVWGWQRNRYFALQAWMATKGDSDLMAVHASGEVLFAGCDESTILSKYNQIIAANGGTQTIVIAAEVSPFHADLGYYYDISTAGLDSTRTGALSYLSAAADWATTYAACTSGVCNSPPKYQFANPGFIMGPVADIAEMLADMPKWADTENRLINQHDGVLPQQHRQSGSRFRRHIGDVLA